MKKVNPSANPIAKPSAATLKRYGLSEMSWSALAEKQSYVCAICKKLPKTSRLCIDHEHVKGWKKMEPERRVKYVRGLLCWVCNHYYCGRGITVDKANNLVSYLENYNHAKEISGL
jgi:hypothetical protein